MSEGDSLGVSISHLQYADDTLVFCDAESEHDCISIGGKSFIYPVNEVPQISLLANILGGKIVELPTTYLGMPLGAKSKSLSI